MKAVLFEQFGGRVTVAEVDRPTAKEHGVVVKVEASGMCRSDWHGWMGHDPDIRSLPHVPGHELAGTVEETGSKVRRWNHGDRVTVPFVCGCGACPECDNGNHHICDQQTQPGFTHWGSHAQYVAIDHADTNLVGLPHTMTCVVAAGLGCRFATSFRAVIAQGRVAPGEWVAVHGCGGIGLSAVMIAAAMGARVIAVDIDQSVLEFATEIGATAVVNAGNTPDVGSEIRRFTERGAHLSIDALGSATTSANSILCLRKRGRHVQVGLLAGADHRPRLPMEHVISNELEILGSHGMQAHRYAEMLDMIASGRLQPQRLIGKTISLEEAPEELEKMGHFGAVGMTVIDRF